MDDWQEAAFMNRHVHNRASKSKAGGGRGRRGGAFEVKKAFGRYDVKCPSASKLGAASNEKKNGKTAGPTVEIFRLSDDGEGLLGELFLPGVLDARVVLAGSRKILEQLISEIEPVEDVLDSVNRLGIRYGGGSRDGDARDGSLEPPEPGESQEEENEAENEDDDDDENNKAFDTSVEDKECSRFKDFEKNSFRSPKFWFQWKGLVTTSSTPSTGLEGSAAGESETGRGYIVFSGNDCRSFKGTITCEALGWKDVSLSGWKGVSMSERDVAFVWS